MTKLRIQLNEKQKSQIVDKTYSNETGTNGTLCKTIEFVFQEIVQKYESKIKSGKVSQQAALISIELNPEFEKKLSKLCNHISVSPSQLLRVVLFQQESDQQP